MERERRTRRRGPEEAGTRQRQDDDLRDGQRDQGHEQRPDRDVAVRTGRADGPADDRPEDATGQHRADGDGAEQQPLGGGAEGSEEALEEHDRRGADDRVGDGLQDAGAAEDQGPEQEHEKRGAGREEAGRRGPWDAVHGVRVFARRQRAG